jgi:hypothetical protein
LVRTRVRCPLLAFVRSCLGRWGCSDEWPDVLTAQRTRAIYVESRICAGAMGIYATVQTARHVGSRRGHSAGQRTHAHGSGGDSSKTTRTRRSTTAGGVFLAARALRARLVARLARAFPTAASAGACFDASFMRALPSRTTHDAQCPCTGQPGAKHPPSIGQQRIWPWLLE